MAKVVFDIAAPDWVEKVIIWAKDYKVFSLFLSNGFKDKYSKYETLCCVGSIDSISTSNGDFSGLKEFKRRHKDRFVVGSIDYEYSYEVETQIPLQKTKNGIAELFFFVPEIVIKIIGDKLSIEADDPQSIFRQIESITVPDHFATIQKSFKPRTSKEEYKKSFDSLHKHIQQGNIYEINLCQKFYIDQVEFDPFSTYIQFSRNSPSPFSVFFRKNELFVLSASPERYLAKRGRQIISQPIKGTIGRGNTEEEDKLNMSNLLSSEKDIAENVMIADLVRNDLTKHAKKGTVSKKSNLTLNSYSHVHQLISTIVCEIDSSTDVVDVLNDTFPMGSMTGAPKINAMKLIDAHEKDRRGIYSGTIGYFDPDHDFDFNVVIRSLVYDQNNSTLCFHTGGAITFYSDMEHEYQECLLKAKNILTTLGTTIDTE